MHIFSYCVSSPLKIVTVFLTVFNHYVTTTLATRFVEVKP